MFKRILLGVVVLALVSAAPAAAQQGKNNDKFITGTAQLGFLETLQPPEIRCAGGEPTGLPFPQCTEGTNRIIGKHEVQLWAAFYPSPSVASYVGGTIQFSVNCTMNANYRGPCWGTFRWDIGGGRLWEGSWTSPVMDLMTYESTMQMVGYGSGGNIDGKHLKFEGGSAPYDWYITGTITIH